MIPIRSTKLPDPPDKEAGAVRIEIKKVDRGQLQVTSWEGFDDYKADTKYAASGWVRSPLISSVKVGFRDDEDPRPFYAEKDLVPGGEWRRFEFVFVPEKDCKASLMFVVKEPGIIDLAGVVLAEKP